MTLFAAIVVAFGCLNAALLAALAGRRVYLSRREARAERIADELRPRVLAYLDGLDALPSVPSAAEERVLVDVLCSYSRLLRGSSRNNITAYLEQHGVVEDDIRALARRKTSWGRASAAQRLGDAGSAKACGPLLRALDDRSVEVRSAAARSLGVLHCSDAVTPLLDAVADRRVPPGLGSWALLQMGPHAVSWLRRALGDERRDDRGAHRADQRAHALMLLGLLGDAADAVAVERQLKDPAAVVRIEAAHALGRLGAGPACASLLAALGDSDPRVRAAAAGALGRLRDRRALAPLIDHARFDDFDVARAAAHAAASIDRERVTTVAAAGARHLQEALEVEVSP